MPEQTTHTLDELVAFYTRTPFLVWISLLSLALLGVLGLAHATEWALERQSNQAPLTPRTPNRRRVRRWSQPGARPAAPPLSFTRPTPTADTEPGYGTFEQTRLTTGANSHGSKPRPELSVDPAAEAKGECEVSEAAMEKTRLVLGVAYGGASGTLSGLCLLLAKTGIELLILTVVGQNQVRLALVFVRVAILLTLFVQFGHVEAWIIVFVLLFAAILQLFYLNRALRLVGPTLICPLAFCFYNLCANPTITPLTSRG